MKRTSKYQLGYFETNDITTAGPEMQRWETLDTQLYALFNVIGNGVINGWGLQASSGLAITVAPGSGNVAFVSVASDGNSIINNYYIIVEGNYMRKSRSKDTPPRILSIQNKKVEQDGTISYFVRYEGYKNFNWASKKYLYVLEENQISIDTFESLAKRTVVSIDNPERDK